MGGAWEGPGVADDILRIAKLAREKNIAAGLLGRDDADVERRIAQGFKLIGFADVSLLIRQVGSLFGRFKGDKYPDRGFR